MAKKLASIVLPWLLTLPGCNVFNNHYIPKNPIHLTNKEKVYDKFHHPNFSAYIVENKETEDPNDRRVDVYEEGGTRKSLKIDSKKRAIYSLRDGSFLQDTKNGKFRFEDSSRSFYKTKRKKTHLGYSLPAGIIGDLWQKN